MRVVLRIVACIAMANMLMACVSTRDTGKPDLSPEQQALQAKVDRLTRKVALELTTLGELNALLNSRTSEIRGRTAGMRPVRYEEGSMINVLQLGGTSELPAACRLYQTYEARKECCPDCSEATLRNGMGYPNAKKGLAAFSAGLGAEVEAVAGNPELITEEIKKDANAY